MSANTSNQAMETGLYSTITWNKSFRVENDPLLFTELSGDYLIVKLSTMTLIKLNLMTIKFQLQCWSTVWSVNTFWPWATWTFCKLWSEDIAFSHSTQWWFALIASSRYVIITLCKYIGQQAIYFCSYFKPFLC